jgi:saccharopine dehydrogenase (NAD+, L-glutamate forming)
MMSGGTFHSAMNTFARMRQSRAAYAARRKAEPRPEGRRARVVAGKPHRDPVLGRWLVPLPTIDPIIVARSGAALPAYGPDFRYSHFAGTKTLRYAVGGASAVAALGVAAQVPPVRRALLGRIKQGEGPDAARRDRSWFTVDFVGEGGGQTVRTRVSGGDPGYDETAKMLAESALCLAFDDNPPTSGQVTTAQAMGDALTARLRAAGLKFEIL